MKAIKILLLFSLVFIVGCQPSEQAIQTAMAQTQVAIPTATATLTLTPLPTETSTPAPTNTPKPTPTLGTSALVAEMNKVLTRIDAQCEVVDAKYGDGAQGKRTILEIHVKQLSDACEYPQSTTIAVLRHVYQNGSKIEKDLYALNIMAYGPNLERKGWYVLEWSDVMQWFKDEISAEALVLRMTSIPLP